MTIYFQLWFLGSNLHLKFHILTILKVSLDMRTVNKIVNPVSIIDKQCQAIKCRPLY